MRFVDRSAFPLPPSLASGALQERRIIYASYYELPEKERSQTRPPDQSIGKDVYEDVMPPLMKVFRGKCAFCEQNTMSREPYQFRPPAYAFDYDKTGENETIYCGWLAYAWQNLYLICEDCKPSTPTFFPTLGPRQPLPKRDEILEYIEGGKGVWPSPIDETIDLIDPCDPSFQFADHFRADKDGQLSSRTPAAENSIRLYRLNRPELVERRARAIENFDASAFFPNSGSEPDEAAEFLGFLSDYFFREPEVAVPFDAFSTEVAEKRETFPKPERVERVRPIPVEDTGPHYDLDTIEVTDFRTLEHVKLSLPPRPDGNLARAILILGENATGKSTLLEAIALTLLNDEAREALIEKPHKLFLNPKFMGSTAPRKSLAQVKLTLKGPKGDERERKLTVTSAGGMQVEGDPFPDNYPVFGYGAYRHYQKPIRRWRPDRGVMSLFRSDDLLSNPEKWLISLDDYQRRLVIMALRIIIGGGFSTIDVEDGECFVVIRDKPQRDDPLARDEGRIISRAPLDTLSSGFRTILALACDMMRWLMDRSGFTAFEHSQGLCVIDEVEAHLHPRWKVSIMSGLRRAFPAMTFIVTTHDPLCIRGMKNGEVMVLQRLQREAADTDLPVFVDTLTTLPDVTQLTVEQLLSSDLFDLFDTTDVETGRDIAHLADILARLRDGQTPVDDDEKTILNKFQSEIVSSLPIGATEVSRLVEEAVADFLIDRRGKPSSKRKDLRQETKKRIIKALEGL